MFEMWNGETKTTYFGLIKGRGFKKHTSHPHQNFLGVSTREYKDHSLAKAWLLINNNYMTLTDMTLYPRLDRVRTCLKNTSAVPLAGGKQISGQRTPRGPASYINHSLSSELSTTICSMHNKWKNGDMFILRTQTAEIENLTVETFMRLAKHNLLASQSG